MTHVVCEPCFDCKYTDCCVVCPVDCFFQDDEMLYIHPADCIDCEACVPECPVAAIFAEANVPAKWSEWIQRNADEAEKIKTAGGEALRSKLDPKKGPKCSDPNH
jgi:ferredoxin